MTDDPIDFGPLDPLANGERFERAVGAITRRAAGELAARRLRASAIGQIVRWSRPMLAAACLVAIVAVSLLVAGPGRGEEPGEDVDLAGALGIPASLTQWVERGEVPTPAQLLAGIEEVP